MIRRLLCLMLVVASVHAWAVKPEKALTQAKLEKPEKQEEPEKPLEAVAAAAPVNLFPRQSWLPPPPPPPPPPKPVAPPLPFQYRGSLLDDGKITVFLAQQTRQIIVKAGEVIDNTYRVDTVSPQFIVFTYLPLNERQQLSTGRNQ